MKPWDQKMTYQLTEHELAQFCKHIDGERLLEQEKGIHELVDRVVEWWTNQRAAPQWAPDPGRYVVHHRASINEYPAGSGEIVINMPRWVRSDMVRYLAEMQIREQLGAQE